MTEYTEKVKAVQLQQELDEYAKGINYIVASNGVMETKYNNGDIHYEYTRGPNKGKSKWHRANKSNESLLDKFQRVLADRRTTWEEDEYK